MERTFGWRITTTAPVRKLRGSDGRSWACFIFLSLYAEDVLFDGTNIWVAAVEWRGQSAPERRHRAGHDRSRRWGIRACVRRHQNVADQPDFGANTVTTFRASDGRCKARSAVARGSRF
jgi:hypothetical protein